MSVISLPAPAPPAPAQPDSRATPAPNAFERYFSSLSSLTSQPAPWDRTAVAGLLSLLLLWAARFYSTWATWGTVSVDSGREMYVPAMLAQGKMLYRDVWYGYAPLAPYWNAFLFQWFGIHLNVLYWAGALAALGCALLLFLAGKQLSSPLAGWTAGAVLLMQAFHGWLFSFPLAYSFSSVYGCLAACLFLWCALHACRSEGSRWMLAAATVAATALLLKLEFGAACYAAFFLLAAARAWQRRSWRRAALDCASALPGLLICAFVISWMLSIGGFAFLTRENLASTWPWSFFMKTYGKVWLEKTGLAITAPALLQSLVRTLFVGGAILEAYLLFWRGRYSARAIALRAMLFAALAAYFLFALRAQWLETLAAFFFPLDMVLYVAIAALLVWWRLSRGHDSSCVLPVAVTLAFAALVAVRTLLATTASGYPIYYNGPAVLSFLILLRPIVPRGRPSRAVLRAELLLCMGCLAVAAVNSARFSADFSDRTALVTERGTVFVSNQAAANYRVAIALMKQESAAGRSVLVVPEDSSLYFLSGTEAPSRLYFFAPGILVPGKMTGDVLRELSQKPIRYILWSSRIFPEYGVSRFGTDFDQPLGSHLTSHYNRVGLLVPDSDIEWQTRFTLWERKPESQKQ